MELEDSSSPAPPGSRARPHCAHPGVADGLAFPGVKGQGEETHGEEVQAQE